MFQPIRVAVCGRKNAPPLFETLEVLGRETTLARIEQAIAKVQYGRPVRGALRPADQSVLTPGGKRQLRQPWS
jgi:hypothetical protein